MVREVDDGIEPRAVAAEPRIVVGMDGSNVVVRAMGEIDRADTTTLAEVLNAAVEAEAAVVIDPETVRRVDPFVAYEAPQTERSCTLHEGCRPVGAEVVATGVVGIRGERATWLIDVGRGRFCRTGDDVDVRFLGDGAWTSVIAIRVTPTMLVAVDHRGSLVTAKRAHLAAAR